MKTPELLVTPKSIKNLEELIEAGADAFIIGESAFGLRLAGEFSRDEVKEALEIAHKHNKKVYVAVNAIFHNEKIDEMTEYVAFLGEIGVDAIVYGDPAVLMAAREVAPNTLLHWNTETTATSWFTCNYWGRRGAKRAVLARELSLDAVVETKENAEIEIEVQIQGMTCMFQSKRSLIGNYFTYLDRNMDISRDSESQMYLWDKERGTKYPVYEDCNGTHIMSPNDICMIDELDEFLDAEIDCLKIDGVLKSAEYIVAITKLYRTAIDAYINNREDYKNIKGDLYSKVENMQPVNRPLDTGFFFKETVY